MRTNDHLPIGEYKAQEDRYDQMEYRYCGKRGLKLPSLSLGLWHNFGDADPFFEGRKMLRRAFDLGVTHFDLANNYGPPYGSAEENFGRMFAKDFRSYRDEIIVATKAGYDMWPGPYGRGGSKKYLVRSCEASLQRMGLDHVDIFYHHSPDLECPVEETADALETIVREGKALYVGVSNYGDPQHLSSLLKALQERRVPLLINQLRHSMFDRRAESVFDLAEQDGFGVIAFSPLEQGLLTGKYNDGIPEGSRMRDEKSYLRNLDPEAVETVKKLTGIAHAHGLSMIELAMKWLFRGSAVCSVLAGAKNAEQLEANVKAVAGKALSAELIADVEAVLD